MDIGGGIGVIGIELAGSGLAGTTMVEASPAFLEAARSESESRYGPGNSQFILGDFVEIANTLPAADVVTLDRVVCCYPDDEALLREAASKALHLLAYTYPRDRWYVRMAIALENLGRRLAGNRFRAFVHSPGRMAATLNAAGFVRDARRTSFVWVLELYRRKGTD